MIDLVARCPYRTKPRGEGAGEVASCRRLQEVVGLADLELCEVRRDACDYCQKTVASGPDGLNAILASMLHSITRNVIDRGGVNGCSIDRALELRRRAEWFLDEDPTEVDQNPLPARSAGTCHFLGSPIGSRIDRVEGRLDRLVVSRCHHPAHLETTIAECDRCLDWTDRSGLYRDTTARNLPRPEIRSGPPVRSWSVGVTTSPRRRPTLQWTLDSLRRAGWDHPRLFVDGAATVPAKHADCPVTQREPNVGAWPNFYLSLAELVFRDPEADAYLMIQDDVEFFEGVRLRDYLESILWPGDRPGPVSLYSCQLDSQPSPGWTRHEFPWFLGAQALVFPAGSAREFLMSREVMAHRQSPVYSGLANIDTLVGSWSYHQGTPITFPTPSLCRHVGHASTLWSGARIEGNRKEGPFAGEIDPTDRAPGSFDESAFACVGDLAVYRSTVDRGIARMRDQTVLIRGSGHNVLHLLTEFSARVERLGSMFGSYRVVIHDEKSSDGMSDFLRDWSESNPSVAQALARDSMFNGRVGDDLLIVVDPRYEGGWSFEGVAHTIGLDDWDYVGSNSLLLGPLGRNRPIFFDRRNYQSSEQNQNLEFRRGESLRPVESCFGGLGIYRMACLTRDEPEPSQDHRGNLRKVRARGFDRIFLNPSQITLRTSRNG